MLNREAMLEVIFELLFANCAENVILARSRLLNSGWILFLIGLFPIESFQVFQVLIFKVIVVFLSILPLVSKRKQGCP